MNTETTHRRPLQEQVDAIQLQLNENTSLTKLIYEDTKEMRELFKDGQALFRLVERLSKLAKPLLWLTGFLSITINWATIKAWLTAIFHFGPKG